MRLITQLIVSWSCPWQALIQLSSVSATTNTTLIPIWAAEGLIRSDRHPPKDDMWKSSNDLYDSEESDKMCSSPVFYTIKSLLYFMYISLIKLVYLNLSNCLNSSIFYIRYIVLTSLLCVSFLFSVRSDSDPCCSVHGTRQHRPPADPPRGFTQHQQCGEFRKFVFVSFRLTSFLLSCSFCSH